MLSKEEIEARKQIVELLKTAINTNDDVVTLKLDKSACKTLYEYIEELETENQSLIDTILRYMEQLKKEQEKEKRAQTKIRELKTKEQRLIEELEEEVTTDNIKAEMTKTEEILYRDIIQEVIEQTVKVVNEYRKEILKILKGEK